MRLTILVDQDGPLSDFESAFYDACKAAAIQFDCEPHEQTHRFASDHIPDRQQRAVARQMCDSRDWFRRLPPVDGAAEGLEELARMADVWIVTKPLESNPWCRDEKAAWVREHLGADWVRRLIIAPDKTMVRGDALVDDTPRREWLVEPPWQPIIYRMPWNGLGTPWAWYEHWDWADGVDSLLERIQVARPRR